MKALFCITIVFCLFTMIINGQKTDIYQQLKEDEKKVHEHLYNELIPFWNNRAVDGQYGGFLTNFDASGKPLEMTAKYLNTQCRMIWWFSQLNMIMPGEDAKSKAKQGVDFLIKYFWDDTNKGWRWKVKIDGSQLDDGKIVYGQSFAIYALSDYYISTGDKRGLDYAEKTFDLLQKYCADTHYGGYYENMEADWTPAQGGFSGGDRKGLDTHMHLMEAFTSLYLASGEELHKRKLIELINLISEKMVDHQFGSGLNQFDLAWKSLPAINIKRTWNAEREGEKPADPTETTSYGHNTELVWLMVRALKAAGESAEPYKPMFRQLLDNAVKYGVDFEKGGIYRDGLRRGGALVLEKEWWQHTESLVGFLEGYELFKDVRYFEAFQAIWNFVNTKMINHEVGEWRRLLDRDGHVIDGNIGNEWKVAYHSGRSMMECDKRLKMLMNAGKE
jgi:cellobiose epimerase